MIKVSIIVPVYNIKDYLEKCIQSIRNQTYKNIEIFLVNDGSLDGSDLICREHARLDDRITVIDKENGGLVSARKAGIRKAQGDYILNIDGDDWIEDVMVESLVSKAADTDADVVTSGYFKESSNSVAKVTDSVKEAVYFDDEDKRYLYRNMIFNGKVERKGITPLIWNKLIRTGLLKEIYLCQSNDINFGEDAASVYSCCALANKIVVTHDIFYHYVMRTDSIVRTADKNYLCNLNEMYLFMYKNFQKSSYSMILKEQLDLLLVQLCMWGINYMLDLSPRAVIPYYKFPLDKIANGNRLVIYGAGRVGQAYYRQFAADKSIKVVGWVDLRHEYYREKGFQVKSIDIIEYLEYDYIVLAFRYMDMADQVKELLISKYHVDENKLVWHEPVNILDI